MEISAFENNRFLATLTVIACGQVSCVIRETKRKRFPISYLILLGNIAEYSVNFTIQPGIMKNGLK